MNRNALEQNEMFNNQVPDVIQTLNTILNSNRGRYVVCEFLIGTDIILRREGYIVEVGMNFVTLFRRDQDLYQVCDLYSLKFMYFSETGIPDVSVIDNNSVSGTHIPAPNHINIENNTMRQPHQMRPPTPNNRPNNFYR